MGPGCGLGLTTSMANAAARPTGCLHARLELSLVARSVGSPGALKHVGRTSQACDHELQSVAPAPSRIFIARSTAVTRSAAAENRVAFGGIDAHSPGDSRADGDCATSLNPAVDSSVIRQKSRAPLDGVEPFTTSGATPQQDAALSAALRRTTRSAAAIARIATALRRPPLWPIPAERWAGEDGAPPPVSSGRRRSVVLRPPPDPRPPHVQRATAPVRLGIPRRHSESRCCAGSHHENAGVRGELRPLIAVRLNARRQISRLFDERFPVGASQFRELMFAKNHRPHLVSG